MSPMIVMTSTWWMDAPPEACWPLVANAQVWPLWWRSIPEVGTLSGQAGRGKPAWPWRALLRRPLRLQAGRRAIDLGQQVEWQIRGDIDASLIWVLERRAQGGCDLTCRWQIDAGFPGPGWLRAGASLLLEHAHFARMRACAHDLALALGCRTSPLREWTGRRHR